MADDPGRQPLVDQYLMEHEQYAQLLQANDVDVLFIRNFVHQTLSQIRTMAYFDAYWQPGYALMNF